MKQLSDIHTAAIAHVRISGLGRITDYRFNEGYLLFYTCMHLWSVKGLLTDLIDILYGMALGKRHPNLFLSFAINY